MPSPSSPSSLLLLLLLALRLLNALLLHTFFQPDEFFQSLEPAWQLAFGPDSGAWITWVGLPCRRDRSNTNAAIGMETPPSILPPSPAVCRRLPRRRRPRARPPPSPRSPCGAPDLRAESCPGRHRRHRGLLHVEASASRLR